MGTAGTALVQRKLGSGNVPDRRPHAYGVGDVVEHSFDGRTMGPVTILSLDGWSWGWSQEPAYLVRTPGKLIKRLLEWDLQPRGGPPKIEMLPQDNAAAQVAKPNRSEVTQSDAARSQQPPDTVSGTSALPAGRTSASGWVFVPGCPLPLRWPLFAPVPRRYWQ